MQYRDANAFAYQSAIKIAAPKVFRLIELKEYFGGEIHTV
jgi:hypothetical protein